MCSKNTILKLQPHFPGTNELTHWGRVTHICIIKLHIIVSDNGLSPGRRQAIIWTNAGILLISPLGTNFNEMLIKIQTFPVKKMHLKMSSAKLRQFCLCLNELMWVQSEGLAKILAMSEVNSEEQKQSGSICGKRNLNKPWPEQNGCYFADNIFKCIFVKQNVFWFEFHWNLLLRIQVTITLQWSRWWLHAELATHHYLNQWWLTSLTCLSVTKLQWVKRRSKLTQKT